MQTTKFFVLALMLKFAFKKKKKRIPWLIGGILISLPVLPMWDEDRENKNKKMRENDQIM